MSRAPVPPLPLASSLSASMKGVCKLLCAETEGGFILNWASSEDFISFFFSLSVWPLGEESLFRQGGGRRAAPVPGEVCGQRSFVPSFPPAWGVGSPPRLPSPPGALCQGGRRPEQQARGRSPAVTSMGPLVGSRSCRTCSLTRLRSADYQLITRREINFSDQLLAAQVPRAARWQEEGARGRRGPLLPANLRRGSSSGWSLGTRFCFLM